MFCALTDLRTESDVEQKLLWPLLTAAFPYGLGLSTADVLTKTSIRRIEIGKGTSRKLYYPDYLVVLGGLPVLVLEAKSPSEDLGQALSEGRLYATELNALYPTGVNPCSRVVACNGKEILSSPWDSSECDGRVAFKEISSAHAAYATFVELCRRSSLQRHADSIRRTLRRPDYLRPIALVGGQAFQEEELPSNTFGATIVGDYGHVFSPQTREDRAMVARHAYIPSLRRQRYLEPIDRLIRTATAPATAGLRTFDSSGTPRELTTALAERRKLEHQVLLLVGSVGSGKSTFVDYVSLVALPDDLRQKTLWVRVNLNEAPLAPEVAYAWLSDALVQQLRASLPTDVDLDDLATLEKVFAPELSALRRGPLAVLDSQSDAFRSRLADELVRLRRSDLTLAKCLARYLCAGPGKLLVVVLDNCDKRTRDEQLAMFQVAQWLQREFRTLVVLPIRDVTFERHRHEPPLDTALKGLIFRIEPPPFVDVLQARVNLALQEMNAVAGNANTLAYVLPNGIRVTYPSSDQAIYLASILKSLYEHDKFVRKIITGLAGRDVRRALEIFLDFCTSGHIGEDEIYKIRFFEGSHVIPLAVVARVLLRMHSRFYNGDIAHIKNLLYCDPDDALPDHFVRLGILHWLERRQNVRGPAGVEGFHRVGQMVSDLVQLGHDATRIVADVGYLIRAGCVVAEHLKEGVLEEGDLVKLTASGLVHLQLMANPEYLAACAEDAFIGDVGFAHRVARRISEDGTKGHFSRVTTARNAVEFVKYLKTAAANRLGTPDSFLEASKGGELALLREAEAAIGAAELEVSTRLYVGNLPFSSREADLVELFATHGVTVSRVNIPPDPSGKSRGFAFVEVASSRDAIRALDEIELALSGRRLTINEATEDRARSARVGAQPASGLSERLYVAGLPPDATEESIAEWFGSHGFQLRDVYVAREKGVPKGYAFVALATDDEAKRAIGALNGSAIGGRRIAVRPASPRSGRDAGSRPAV
jgi:hypothetical protein